MKLQSCPLRKACVCDNYKPVVVQVAELKSYLGAQVALVFSPLNVWGTGEELKRDPRELTDAENKLWKHYVESGGAKRFAEENRHGQTAITVCRYMIQEDGT